MSPPSSFITRSKTVNETISLIADFRDFLTSGETISSYSVTVSVFSGEDPDPSNILYMVPELHKGYLVEQRFRLGVPGVIYSLLFSATTSIGNILEITSRLAVLPNIGTAIPVFIPLYLTSLPYPINVTESLQSPAINSVSGRLALQPYIGPESIQGITTVNGIDIFGSGVTYSNPFESIQGLTAVSQIDIFGSGITYTCPPESITGDTAVMQIDIFGSGVSYNIPAENIQGVTLVTSVTIS